MAANGKGYRISGMEMVAEQSPYSINLANECLRGYAVLHIAASAAKGSWTGASPEGHTGRLQGLSCVPLAPSRW